MSMGIAMAQPEGSAQSDLAVMLSPLLSGAEKPSMAGIA